MGKYCIASESQDSEITIGYAHRYAKVRTTDTYHYIVERVCRVPSEPGGIYVVVRSLQ